MSKLPITEKSLKTAKTKWLFSTILFFLIYAIMRYLVFKGVNSIHFPLYIVNKVMSVSGIFFLAMSYTTGKINWPKFQDTSIQNQFSKYLGLAGFSLIAMHGFISIIIISPAYFPKYYQDDMMNFTGEMSMLMGVLSLYFFTIPAITTLPFMQEAFGMSKWQKRQQMGYFGLLTALLHAGFMGFSGWIAIAKWPGYLPPISLISAIIAAFPLFLKISKKN